ncbi:MAG: efflux transporter outer membrane subunit [Thermoanaerobaculia bacterium]
MSDRTAILEVEVETEQRSVVLTSFSRSLGSGLLALLVASCATAPAPTTREVVETALPETTRVPEVWSAEAEDSGYVDDGWIASFDDQQLEALVEQALANNPNLRIAAAQVDRAAGLARVAGSALKPTVSLAGDIAEIGGDSAVSGTSYSAGIAVSWEADVWGRVRAGATAGEEALAATVADYEYARQSLAAATAKSWFLATESRMLLDLASETVELYRQLLELVETKHRVGRVSMQDVHLARADLASSEEAVRQARSGNEQAVRGLEALLGRYPSAELETARDLVPVPPPIPIGLPSEILERRPDLIAAERRVAAAFFKQEEARLARLPRFTLTAGVGGSDGLSEAIGSLGAGLFAPLFTGGALAGQLQAASADQRAAIAAYGQAALRAFQEVETSLSNERLFEERQGYLLTVVEENEKAWELAKVQYDVGRVDLLSVVQMQARWLGARISLIRIQSERISLRVNLHLALGGSFAAPGREKAAPAAEEG